MTIHDPKLTDICWSPMTLLSLRQHGIHTVTDLVQRTEEELTLIPGCNRNQIDLFKERLAKLGKALKDS